MGKKFFEGTEAKGREIGVDVAVSGPVLVLGWAVVEVLGSEDERSEEDAVGSAAQAPGKGLQPWPEAGEVDQRGHQSRDLNVGGDD